MTNERLNGKTAWEFACDWYTPDQIAYSIKNRHRMPSDTAIPDDIDSAGFAQWLTEQYRLAMTKGIQIAQQDSTARLAARKLFELAVPALSSDDAKWCVKEWPWLVDEVTDETTKSDGQ